MKKKCPAKSESKDRTPEKNVSGKKDLLVVGRGASAGAERLVDLIGRAIDATDEARDYLLVIFEKLDETTAGSRKKNAGGRFADQREALETVARRLGEDLRRAKERLRLATERYEATLEQRRAANAELQAAGEALATVNHELQAEIDETGRVNSDLRNLLAATDIATLFLDKDLRIRLFTPPAGELFNITRADVGRPLDHFTHRLRCENLVSEAERVLRQMKPVELELEDGGNRFYLARFLPHLTPADRVAGVVLNFIDITERKHVEESLHESEEQLQLIIESTKDYAIITFDLKGFVTRWNTGAERIFGYPEKEAVGRYGAFLFTPEDQARGVPEEEMKTTLERGRAEDERWHLRKNGTRFYVSGVMHPLKDSKTEGFVKIARDLTERIKTEAALREKEMFEKLVAAQEDERRRIARDLHDELGQQMTALRIRLDTFRNNLGEAALLEPLDEIREIARRIDDGVDFLAWELRPTALEDLGLATALDSYIKQWSHYSGVKAELIISNLKRARLAPEVETCLYRVAQEALNNVHKHSKATRVEVVLEKRADLLVLIIEDNGKGFDRKNKMDGQKGMGLVGMKERAALVGGTLEIETARGKGTTIYVRIPFSDAPDKSRERE